MAKTESWQKSMWRDGQHCYSDARDLEMLVLVSIMVLERMQSLFDHRDAYRGYLVPGGGYRVTSQAMFEFSSAVFDAALQYRLPHDIFEQCAGHERAIGHTVGRWEED